MSRPVIHPHDFLCLNPTTDNVCEICGKDERMCALTYRPRAVEEPVPEKLRNFFEGVQVSDEKAQWLESTGQAHVSGGGSGGRPNNFDYRDVAEGPWILFRPGPGNVWIENQIGTCIECGHPWREHLRPVWIRRDKDHTCINAPMVIYCQPFTERTDQ